MSQHIDPLDVVRSENLRKQLGDLGLIPKRDVEGVFPEQTREMQSEIARLADTCLNDCDLMTLYDVARLLHISAEVMV